MSDAVSAAAAALNSTDSMPAISSGAVAPNSAEGRRSLSSKGTLSWLDPRGAEVSGSGGEYSAGESKVGVGTVSTTRVSSSWNDAAGSRVSAHAGSIASGTGSSSGASWNSGSSGGDTSAIGSADMTRAACCCTASSLFSCSRASSLLGSTCIRRPSHWDASASLPCLSVISPNALSAITFSGSSSNTCENAASAPPSSPRSRQQRPRTMFPGMWSGLFTRPCWSTSRARSSCPSLR